MQVTHDDAPAPLYSSSLPHGVHPDAPSSANVPAPHSVTTLVLGGG